MKKIVFLSAITSSLISVTGFANTAENCHSNIINTSNQAWVVTFKSLRGNVYFPDLACQSNGPCVIPAHSIANLEFTYNTHVALGVVQIKDYKGKEKDVGYLAKNTGDCPRFEASDNTPGISLNTPATGSFTILSDALSG